MSGLECNPFGETQVPWRRSLLWSGKSRAPRRYAGTAAVLGPLAGLVLQSGDGLDEGTRLAIVAVASLVPPYVVESWWRARERRRQELVLPE